MQRIDTIVEYWLCCQCLRFLTSPVFSIAPLFSPPLSRFHAEGESRGASVHYRVGQPAPRDSSSTQREPQVSHYRGGCAHGCVWKQTTAFNWRSDSTEKLYLGNRHVHSSTALLLPLLLCFHPYLKAKEIKKNIFRNCLNLSQVMVMAVKLLYFSSGILATILSFIVTFKTSMSFS